MAAKGGKSADDKARRAALIAELDAAGRASSTGAVMFHARLAELQGLSVTEEKSLDLLQRFGPMTAGELAERSGLSKASVTGLVDRLVHKGFAARSEDPDDKRRVVVSFVEETALRLLGPLFVDFVRELHALYAKYDEADLRVALRFMKDVTAVQAAARERLGKAVPERADPPKSATRKRTR